LEDLALALGEEIIFSNDDFQDSTAPRSPGACFAHYAPRARVIFAQNLTDDIAARYSRIGRIFFQRPSAFEERKYDYVIDLSQREGLEGIARELYGALREADAFGCDLIIVDSCAETGVGLAIMDRLRRAIKR
jgi:L-threonylcarbamoyladenylate synthase